MSIFLTSYLYLLLNWKTPKLACQVKGLENYLIGVYCDFCKYKEILACVCQKMNICKCIYCLKVLYLEIVYSFASNEPIWRRNNAYCVFYLFLLFRHEYQIFQKITKLEYEFPDGFSPVARDLVENLLVCLDIVSSGVVFSKHSQERFFIFFSFWSFSPKFLNLKETLLMIGCTTWFSQSSVVLLSNTL